MERYCTQISWEDVPHLTADQKERLLAAIPPHQRDARTKGLPILGAGQIYPIAEELVVIDPIKIPVHWPKAYGLDVGWNITAAIFGAWDRDSDVVYLYSEYYAGQQPPAMHSSAIMARGNWIYGAIDPSAAGSNQKDGTKLIDEYRNLMLNLVPADNAVEAGIHACYQRMASGGLKVFNTCRNWISEFRIYRRDTNGKVVKERDHLMDATRYLIMTGMQHAHLEPNEQENMEMDIRARQDRSQVTGY